MHGVRLYIFHLGDGMYSSLNVIRSDNYNIEFRKNLGVLQSTIKQLSNIFSELLLVNDINNVGEEKKKMMESATLNVKFILQSLIEFLKVPENRQYLLSTFEGYTFQYRLNRYLHSLMELKILKNRPYNKNTALLVLSDLREISKEFHSWLYSYTDHIGIQRDHDKKIDQLSKEIADSQAELHRINSQRTELIYSNASLVS